MKPPAVIVEPRAQQLKFQKPQTREEFVAMARKNLLIPAPKPVKLPPMVMSNWNVGTAPQEGIVLHDVRLRPFQQTPQLRLSVTKVSSVLLADGRRPLNGLEAVALVAAINCGEIKMPIPCDGIAILGAGIGKRILVLRKNKHAEWQFAEIPSNHTEDHYYASCKA